MMRFDYETKAYRQELLRQADRERLVSLTWGNRSTTDWYQAFANSLAKAMLVLGGRLLQPVTQRRKVQANSCVEITRQPVNGGTLVISKCAG
jgi:hypothetical protein